MGQLTLAFQSACSPRQTVLLYVARHIYAEKSEDFSRFKWVCQKRRYIPREVEVRSEAGGVSSCFNPVLRLPNYQSAPSLNFLCIAISRQSDQNESPRIRNQVPNRQALELRPALHPLPREFACALVTGHEPHSNPPLTCTALSFSMSFYPTLKNLFVG